ERRQQVWTRLQYRVVDGERAGQPGRAAGLGALHAHQREDLKQVAMEFEFFGALVAAFRVLVANATETVAVEVLAVGRTPMGAETPADPLQLLRRKPRQSLDDDDAATVNDFAFDLGQHPAQ